MRDVEVVDKSRQRQSDVNDLGKREVHRKKVWKTRNWCHFILFYFFVINRNKS